MEDKQLIDDFHEAMLGIYHRALKEAHYKASIFLNMVIDHGGRETAIRLIHAPKISDGYAALLLRNRLDLTVEALIHDNARWHPLFTTHELEICSKRLSDVGYLK